MGLWKTAGTSLTGYTSPCNTSLTSVNSMQDIHTQFDTNVFGAFKVMKGCIPHFRSQRRGHILNVSSTAAVNPHCYFSTYSASKFALEGASEALAEELKDFGIRVVILEPGATRTNFFNAVNYTPFSDGYRGTTVEKIHDIFKSMEGKQSSDPKRSASAVVDIVDESNEGEAVKENLRVQLGSDAVERANGKLAALQGDWGRAERIAESCKFVEAES